jgi:hypothetical protein
MRAEILDTLVPEAPTLVRDLPARARTADTGLAPDSVATFATGD